MNTGISNPALLRERVDTSDAELVERYRQGDRSAFTELVHRWENSVLRIAFRIVGNLQEAEEIRQQVFLKLIEANGTLRNPQRVGPWMRSCTVNLAVSAVRDQKRKYKLNEQLRHSSPTAAMDSLQDRITDEDEAEQLRTSLLQLEPEQRALMSLRFDEGLTFQEMAVALNRPSSTVKSQFAKTMEQLRKLLNVRAGEQDQL